MKEIVQELKMLELQLHELIKENEALRVENEYLKDSLLKSEDKFIQKEKLNKELEEQNKRLKVINAISGNNEYKKVMKLQMNRMIKEIDSCILEIQNT
ncbi:hypothetical protein [Apibacter adventoris]|uniref:Uncharacterized protein n=1 Tax=Apibacter adventoris TaxID=1679466 RepID=A0A2S8A701_9FLAO|nr:hypothetical protein [Apibacter adventoris]PQL90342.1 hypothetical protein C4S77_10610 [Apibacter adventoris]PQL95825.1 hypothetical protein C4S76_01300 [Apibacter adventoris]